MRLDDEEEESAYAGALKGMLLGFLYSFMHINGTHRLSFCVEQLGYVSGWYNDLLVDSNNIS